MKIIIILIQLIINFMHHSVHYFRPKSSPATTLSTGGGASVSFAYDYEGNRKYTNINERKRFLRAAQRHPDRHVRTFCLVLALSGARISEVLELTARQIDIEAGVVVIKTKKQRKRRGDETQPLFRAVPMPHQILSELDKTHDIRKARRISHALDRRLWSWCRTTAWKRVKEVMHAADINGLHACPKGLRHGFAIGALLSGVPEITLKNMLGHARIETTMIYSEAIGAEARSIAKRMWEPLLD